MQDDNEIDFFWRKPRIDSRGRFNLLLLEYGETFHENLSCNQYPFPNQNLTFVQCDALKCKGRLHICSRSMIFEPNDIKCPLLKFPYKLITSNVEQYYLKAEEVLQCTSATSGFVTFSCSSHFEMKNNDKVGPYKLMSTKSQFVFALIHTDIIAFFHKMKQLRGELTANMKGGGRGQNLFAQSFKSQTFDSSQLIDFNERLLFLDPVVVFRVGPLVLHPGELMVTDTRIYFQPSNLNNIEDLVQHLDVKKIKRIFSRRYLLRQTGMEISFDKSCTGDNDREMRNVYFVFETTSIRDHIIASIKELPLYPNIVNDEQSIESMTWKWQKKKVSNFEYLLFLNSEADRSFSDLTQYPVMPHIIKDYGSNKLDFTKEETFRDLSKPIGALNPQRLAFFKERYEAMLDIASDPSQPGDNHIPVAPPFLYGTHYSTPGYVLFFLVRQAPEYMLCLQSGKFDAPDRMFYSISSMFSSCLSNPADLKELIPEFFYGEGEFLYNTENLDLGCRHNGERVHDVELPPWAKNPKDFVRKSREALESDYVSAHLHEWIDLIFGYKQRGDAAIAADNLFYHLTYEGSLGIEYDLSASQAESFSNFNPASRKEKNSQTNLEREANDIQVQEFGQTPKQLFSDPHPRKGGEMADIDITKSKGRRSSLGLTGNETAMTSLKANSIEQPSLERKSLTTTGLDTSMSKSWSKGMDIYKKAKDRVMNARIIDRKDNAMTVDSKSHSTISNNNNLNDTEELRKDTTKTMQHSDFLARGGPSPTLLDLLPESLVVSVKKEVDKNDDDKNWRKNKNDNGVNFEVHDDKQFPSVNHSLDPSSIFNQEVVVMEESALVTPTSPITVRMRSLCDSLPEKTGLMTKQEMPWKAAPSPSKVLCPAITTSLRDFATSPSSLHINFVLWETLHLSSKEAVTGLSALLLPVHSLPNSNCRNSQDHQKKVVLCASTKGSVVAIFNVTETFRHKSQSQFEKKDIEKKLGGWKLMSSFRFASDDEHAQGVVQKAKFIAGTSNRLVESSTFKPLSLRSLALVPLLFPASLDKQLASQYSSCRLSTDGSRLLVSSQRGSYCSLYSYSVPQGRLLEQNLINVEQRKIDINTNPCITIGRGSQCLVSGSQDGTVRLWFLGLHLSTLHDNSLFPDQHPLAVFRNLHSQVLCVTQTLSRPPTNDQVSTINKTNTENSNTSSLNKSNFDTKETSNFNKSTSAGRIMVAAGSKDGTVAVWDVDTSVAWDPEGSFRGPASGSCGQRGNHLLLFCHQLRPAERPVVCVEWLTLSLTFEDIDSPSDERESSGSGFGCSGCNQSAAGQTNACQNDAGQSVLGQIGKLVLLSGASDGTLHCVDCYGRVLAVCEVQGCVNSCGRNSTDSPKKSFSKQQDDERIGTHSIKHPEMRVMTLTTSSSAISSSCLIFCGFSDGSIHVASLSRTNVHITPFTPQPNNPKSISSCKLDELDIAVLSGVKYRIADPQEIVREVIEMRVITVIPIIASSSPQLSITALCWLTNSISDRAIQKKTERVDGTLISGYEGGIIRLHRTST